MSYHTDEVNKIQGRIRKKVKNEFSSELVQSSTPHTSYEEKGKNESITQSLDKYEIYPGE